MLKYVFFCFLFAFSIATAAQVIQKPIGCFAGSNGTHPLVLAHNDARGVLLVEKWKDIEPIPGVFDFSALNAKINTVVSAGMKYTFAISGGAIGSPDWLIDSLNVGFHSFQFQNQPARLPFWWDSICGQRLTSLIMELGNQYANDPMLSHVYVTQMTVNGIEGHLNGVDMTAFTTNGFTEQKWITAAKNTVIDFSFAFPDKPIVFEIHEIDHDTLVPATIMNDLYENPDLCQRIGLGMWWLSGKTSYQSDLIDFITSFQGDKYAQVIGRSDQIERFQDSLYSNVFLQAKDLGIRYIEPWPYEFQYHTNDSLIHDFNSWTDSNFTVSDNCSMLKIDAKEKMIDELMVYPNPTKSTFQIKHQIETNATWQLFSLSGRLMKSGPIDQLEYLVDITDFEKGIYILKVSTINGQFISKIVKQ